MHHFISTENFQNKLLKESQPLKIETIENRFESECKKKNVYKNCLKRIKIKLQSKLNCLPTIEYSTLADKR